MYALASMYYILIYFNEIRNDEKNLLLKMSICCHGNFFIKLRNIKHKSTFIKNHSSLA